MHSVNELLVRSHVKDDFFCLCDFKLSTFVFSWMHLRIISHNQTFTWNREEVNDVYEWWLSPCDKMSAWYNVKRRNSWMYYCIGALKISDGKRFSCHQSKETESAKLSLLSYVRIHLTSNTGRLIVFSRQYNLIVCLTVQTSINELNNISIGIFKNELPDESNFGIFLFASWFPRRTSDSKSKSDTAYAKLLYCVIQVALRWSYYNITCFNIAVNPTKFKKINI